MISLPDIEATERLAQQIATLLRSGDCLALQGNLGAGKTTFARALLKELGYIGDVPSPTFTLVQSYELKRFSLHHFDLYRLKDSSELDELGWDEALSSGVTLIEWPEKAGNRLTTNALTLHFDLDKVGNRTCRFEGSGTWPQRLKGIAA